MAVKDWSTTAADNDDADGAINWLEGMAPSAVNDSARAVMAAIASWYLLIDQGTVSGGTVGGTADAITLTCSPTVSALAAGQRYMFRAGSANTGAVTLNVDGLGATALRYRDTALVANDIASGDIVLCMYDASTTRFQMLNPPRLGGTSTVSATQTQMEAASALTAPATPGNVIWHPGVSKFWINFDGTGTPTAAVSHNLTSITDGGTGRYTLTIATDFSGASYAIACMCNQTVLGNMTTSYGTVRSTDTSAMAAGTVEVNIGNANAGTATDATIVSVITMGDRA